MDEYIEREAAVNKLTAMINESGKYTAYESGLDDAAYMIEHEIPAADVVPVVRAENVGKDYAECDQFVCSKCGIELQDWHRVERDEDDGEETYHEYVFRFCPNCGALMDKDGDGE